jgi:DNA repair protein RadC
MNPRAESATHPSIPAAVADGGVPFLSDQGTPHWTGHRQRLRQRLLTAGADALADYELLEALLFAIPRRDVKPLAKQLLARFGDLGGVLAASPAALAREKVPEAGIAALQVVQALHVRVAREPLPGRELLGSWPLVLNYLQRALAREPVEQVRVLYLDIRNQLLADERQGAGTVDQAPAYPREIVKRALEVGASALLLVHNHPSGDNRPSGADIETTHAIGRAAAALGIKLHDHIIIGRGVPFSMRGEGLLASLS